MPPINTEGPPSIRSLRAFLFLDEFGALQSHLSPFAISDADRIVNLQQEDLPIPNLARCGMQNNGIHNWFDAFIRNNNLDAKLRDQTHFVLSTAVCFAVTFLPSVPPNLRHSHSLYTKFRERIFDLIKPARSYNRLYFGHFVLASIHGLNGECYQPSEK
jgi:hypothetical protein